MNAAALVRSGAPVVVGADSGLPAVQALVRWDPRGMASRELAERAELAFPPFSRMASLTAGPAAIADLVGAADLPEGAELIGPVPVDADTERLLVRVSRDHGAQLAAALKTAAAGRSARRSAEAVRIELDPATLG